MKRLLVGLVVVGLLSGCGQVDLHHELSEADADEILVLLSSNGIDAIKGKEVVQQRTTWKLSVPSRYATRARALLLQHNLPRRRAVGLAEVYKEKGIIPSPDEQKARFLLALKGEIINSLERVPGIMDADVVLNVPDQPAFAEGDKKRPTASVIIRARPTGEVLKEDKIQQFVANAVDGLDPRDVAVIISYIGKAEGVPPDAMVPSSTIVAAAPTLPGSATDWIKVGGLKLDRHSAPRFRLYAGLILILLILVAVGLVYSVYRLSRMRATAGGLIGPDRQLAEGVGGTLPPTVPKS